MCVCVYVRKIINSLQPKSLLQMDWNARSAQRRMSSANRILTMLSVLLLCVLASGLAAATTSSEEEDSSSTSSPPFTDQWAVHISGGDQVADAIAARHGFTNLGKVKILIISQVKQKNSPPTVTFCVLKRLFIIIAIPPFFVSKFTGPAQNFFFSKKEFTHSNNNKKG